MARPRKDDPVIGKPRSAWVEARKKDGKVISFYLRFRDQAGGVHTVETVRTTSRNKAEKRKDEWMAGWAIGDRRIVAGTREALAQFLGQHHNPSSRETSEERISDFCAYMNWTDCRDWTFEDFAGYLTARLKGVGRKATKTGKRVKRKPWRPITLKTRRVSVQTWLTWLYVEDITRHDIGKDRKGRRFKGPRVEDGAVRWMTKPGYRTLMAALASPGDYLPVNGSVFGKKPGTQARLHALEPGVALGSLGLRLHDIQQVTAGRVHLAKGDEAGSIDLRNLKGHSSRVVPLPDDVEEVLIRHGIHEMGAHDFIMGAEFRDRSEGKTNYGTVLLRNLSSALGVLDNTGRGITWHTLRRSCGVWLAQSGRSEADIGAALGHVPGSPTPRRYTAAVPNAQLIDAWIGSRE